MYHFCPQKAQEAGNPLQYCRAHLEVEVRIAVMQQIIRRLAEVADSADQLWGVHGHRVFNIHPFYLELHRR